MIRKLLFLFLLIPVSLSAQLKVPPHSGVWVHDEAHVLSAGAKQELESILKAERDATTNQIAVLIVPSLEGEALEEYTLKVAEDWKLGKKDTDNGVLFFISIQDKKMRIEAGQGQEGQLTDAASSRINRNEVAPHFRQGDYDGGVKAGVLAIINTIKGQYVNNDPPVNNFRKRGKRNPWLSLIVIIIIIAAASRRRGGGGGIAGGMGGYWAAGMLGGMGSRGGGYSGGGGGDYGGGGSFGGGGSSDSW